MAAVRQCVSQKALSREIVRSGLHATGSSRCVSTTDGEAVMGWKTLLIDRQRFQYIPSMIIVVGALEQCGW